MSGVHRGRTKAGKVQVHIHLTSEELALLDRLAEKECRSRTMQATYIILRRLHVHRLLGNNMEDHA